MATVSPIKPTERVALDDGVREVHGCKTTSDARIVLDEDGRHIRVGFFVSDKFLSPKQARYLARKLHHLARRIEQRELTGAA
jgi:hypothetical protein